MHQVSDPVVVVLKDMDDSSHDRYYIMIEQVMFNDTPDFTHALFLLLAVCSLRFQLGIPCKCTGATTFPPGVCSWN